MPERRQAKSSSSTTRAQGVRRNLFQQHLSRRPTTSSTSTSSETLRLDIEPDSDSSDIVIRDKNGDFEIEDPSIQPFDGPEEGGQIDPQEDEKERERLADAVKHHQRNRNRAPSEPAELLEAVRTSLRAKVARLAEDNWMYEAEDDLGLR
ncbi:uncharacterized protein L3040_003896 [Drepanopeziza brunnea f. sp. 'multigermtubi']|uniref:UPF0220 domain protein n=1 Tax=Marssonina brunnea f. sp. multigermtubi (strain MB_m1) TaxID=1072389 RepID=K1X272_MARBU|nr:UPF0220 domain protein [Drepanopeziza brunnea f. sp. 'multigermtubi' MB_m1]EKD14888.1 UPF0220 domain protein [Drepanopeziza brunnea f. sp. 'multigermtubi' MB_m1]KAJ5046662.1 hypothetical protein L3040_003896 [Drepanopeziza brunnea f. sp. 'multigermtubi']